MRHSIFRSIIRSRDVVCEPPPPAPADIAALSTSMVSSPAAATRTAAVPTWAMPAPVSRSAAAPAVARPVAAAAPAAPRAATWSASTDVALLAILHAPLHPEDTVAVGFARKEAELLHVFASLTVLESRTLHARLSNPKPDDTLAQAFKRLTADRRARLINFLADARRREALRR